MPSCVRSTPSRRGCPSTSRLCSCVRWPTTASWTLDRTPVLEEACYRIALSQQRVASQRAAVTAILDRRLELADDLAGNVPDDFREVLDRARDGDGRP